MAEDNADRLIMEEKKKQIEKLKQENWEIHSKIKKAKDEMEKVIAKMSNQAQDKLNEYNKLKQSFLDEQAKNEKERTTIKQQLELQLNDLQEKQQIEIEKYKLEVMELQEIQASNAQLKAEKNKIEEDMSQLTQKYEQIVDTQKMQLDDHQWHRMLEMSKLAQEHADRRSQVEKSAFQQAKVQLDKVDKNLHKQNNQLLKEINEQRGGVEGLRLNRLKILAQNNDLKRNLDLSKQCNEEYEARELKLRKQIQQQKEKVRVMKNQLQEVLQEFEKEKEQLNEEFSAQLNDKEQEIQQLKFQASEKAKESQQLKQLCQTILHQRQSTEQFFLGMLKDIKASIIEKKASVLPQIPQQKETRERVDFADLDLEDKERVLRLLYSKINKGGVPKQWKDESQLLQLPVI